MAHNPKTKPPVQSAASFGKVARKKIHDQAQARSMIKKATPSVLDYSWIIPIHALQGEVVAELEMLKPGEKKPKHIHWLRQREINSITEHIQGGMPVVGLVLKNELLGFALLAFPENTASSNVSGYPVKHPEQTMIIQSFIVSPALRGLGAGKKLMEIIEDEAAAQQRPILMGRVAADNEDSRSAFSAAGFSTLTKDPQNFSFVHDKFGLIEYQAHHWEKLIDMNDPTAKPAVLIGRTHWDTRPRPYKGTIPGARPS